MIPLGEPAAQFPLGPLLAMLLIVASQLGFSDHNAATLKFLPRLAKEYSTIACGKSAKPTFHAQVSGKFITAKDFGVLDDKKIERLATTWANHNRHPGFAYGKCSEEKAWILSVPTVVALTVDHKGLTISKAQLNAQCRESSIDFSRSEGGLSQKINFSTTNRINTEHLPKGFLSVTCIPKDIEHIGPRLLYLVPIKDPEDSSPPFHGTIVNWLSALRKDPLRLNELGPLQEAAATLGKNTSIDHDRELLSYVKQKARAAGWEILGEDRARGENLSSILQLLWQSPRHRDLLLDPRASDFAFFFHAEKDGVFLLLITARKTSLNAYK